MPFEGDIGDYTVRPVETPVQSVIRRARELISERAGWSSHNYREGDAFCILGALRVAHHDNAWRPGTGGAQDYVMRVLRRRGYTGITTFNDHHASHADALAVLDAAYEAAGKPKGAKLDLSGISWANEPPPPAVAPPSPQAGPLSQRLRALGGAIDRALRAVLSRVVRRAV